MSRSIKMIIAGLCLALATTSTASAQVSQMRLFSPFPDDQFGGGIYEHEGMYGSISAGVLSLSQPRDQVVGSLNGGQQYVTNVVPNVGSEGASTTFTYSEQVNQINTSQFHADWETATRFTIGNQDGHHGWEFSGTLSTSATTTLAARRATTTSGLATATSFSINRAPAASIRSAACG